MKISKIIPYVLNEDLEKEFFFSQWEYSNRKICIVKIICDGGINNKDWKEITRRANLMLGL